MARLAMLLALYTGQRRSDVVRMGWEVIEYGFTKVRQEKTKARLGIPIATRPSRAQVDTQTIKSMKRLRNQKSMVGPEDMSCALNSIPD